MREVLAGAAPTAMRWGLFCSAISYVTRSAIAMPDGYKRREGFPLISISPSTLMSYQEARAQAERLQSGRVRCSGELNCQRASRWLSHLSFSRLRSLFFSNPEVGVGACDLAA